MKLTIYNKNVKWTKDSIDKPYFYSKEQTNIKQNILDFFDNPNNQVFENFKINGSDMEYKSITIQGFKNLNKNYCSIEIDNKNYYYFIEKIDILNAKGLIRLSLQLDTWTTYFEDIVNKFGNSVVAIRKHGKRFKRRSSSEVIYDYSRTSNVWNIDSQFSNLAKQFYARAIYKTSYLYTSKNIIKVLPPTKPNAFSGVHYFKANGTSVSITKDADGIIKPNNTDYWDDLTTSCKIVNNISWHDLLNKNTYTKIKDIKTTSAWIDWSPNSTFEVVLSNEELVSDSKNYQYRIDSNLLKFEENKEDLTIDGNYLAEKIDSIRYGDKKYGSVVIEARDAYNKIINLVLNVVEGRYDGGYGDAFISLTNLPLNRITLSLEYNASQNITKYIYSDTSDAYKDITPCLQSNLLNQWMLNVKQIAGDLSLDGYENIKPYELININDVEYDYLKEPQIWMSHCYNKIFNIYNQELKVDYEINLDANINIYRYISQNQIYQSMTIDYDDFINSFKQSSVTLNSTLPSNSDKYAEYLVNNQNSLETSLYGIDKNIDFTKKSGNLSVKQATVNAAFSGISSVANIGASVAQGAFMGGGVAGGVAGAISGIANVGSTIASGVMGVESAQLASEKNNFNANMQLKQVYASQLDKMNEPDNILGVVQDFFARGVFEKKVESEIVRCKYLPTISTIQEYADYLNRFGYVSGNQIHDFSKDKILIRKRFNYWEIQDISIGLIDRENIPMFALKFYREQFNNGVRMWVDYNNMYDYSKENWEYEI